MTITVGILGLAGSGKDTFANMLLEHLPDFKIDRYARPLKELTCRIFGLTMEEVEDRVIKETPVQVSRDVVVQEVFGTLSDVLNFTNEELDKASELFFEHFQSARARSPREFQQIFGTDVVRAVKPTAWVDRLRSVQGNLIVPDVRFENELCDYNIMVLSEFETPRPQHTSEHYAWDLEHSQVCTPVGMAAVDNNPDYVSLEQLTRLAKKFADHIKTL